MFLQTENALVGIGVSIRVAVDRTNLFLFLSLLFLGSTRT